MMFNKIALILLIMPTALKLMAMMSDDTAYDRHGPLRLVTSNGKKRQLSPDELKSLESAILHGAVSFRLTQAAVLGVDPHDLADDPTANPYLTARALKIVRELARDKTRTDEVLAKRKVDVLAELAVAADNLQIDWLKLAAYGAFAQKMTKTRDKTFDEFAWVLERVIAGSREEAQVADQLPQLPIIKKEGISRMFCLTWSPDGKHLAIVRDGTEIELWNARGDELERTISLPADAHGINKCKWAPNGVYLLGFDFFRSVVHVLNQITGELEQTIRNNLSVSWSPNGAYMVACDRDRGAYLYGSSPMRLLCILECETFLWFPDTDWREIEKYHRNPDMKVVWSPDGNLIAISHSKWTNVFDLTGERLYVIRGRDLPKWSADSQRLLVCGAGFCARTGELCFYRRADEMFYSPGNKYMLAYREPFSNECDIVDTDTGKIKQHFTFCFKSVKHVLFSPDSTMLAVGGDDDHGENEIVSMINMLTGAIETSFSIRCGARECTGCAWSADNQYFAIYNRAQIGVWNKSTACVQYPTIDSEIREIYDIEWISDNRRLVVMADLPDYWWREKAVRHVLYLYDVVINRVAELKYDLEYRGNILSSSDGKRFAIQGYDRRSNTGVYICPNQFMFSLPELVKELRLYEHKK